MTARSRLSANARVVAIVQARMRSSRMPGKVLAPLAGKPAFVHLIERAQMVSRIDEIVLATSLEPSDDPVVAVGSELGIRITRGSLEDVLERYYDAATQAKADVVVRLTADCPMHDSEVIARGVDVWADAPDPIAYVSNAEERSYPHGLDVEVFSFAVLEEAHFTTRDAIDREHVTPWIVHNRQRRAFVQEQDLSALRWTMDYPEDYKFISVVFDALDRGARPFGAVDVYRWLRDHPDRMWTGLRRSLEPAERADLLTRIEAQIRIEETRA